MKYIYIRKLYLFDIESEQFKKLYNTRLDQHALHDFAQSCLYQACPLHAQCPFRQIPHLLSSVQADET